MVNKLVTYLKQSKEELAKVDWPNRRETLQKTLIVLAVSLSVAAFLGATDFVLNKLLELVVV